MARPRKNNADYFSHDNNMRKDTKIESVRSKFGNEGYAIWCMLLEVLSESDCFKKALKTDIEWELLAGDFRVETLKLQEIIKYFEIIGLIKRKNGHIFCPKLVERLSPLLEKRANMRVSAPETRVSAPETRVSDAEMPHSKVKHSIVKNKERVFKNKKGEPITLVSGDEYVADGWSPKQQVDMRRRIARALGEKKTNAWSQLLFGSAWDFKKAFKNFLGYEYTSTIMVEETARVLASWYENGETRDTVREILLAFFQSDKSKAVTITPKSVFSPHTYDSFKQGKLVAKEIKKPWWE